MIIINIVNQSLLFQKKKYPISTAKNGLGEENNSCCTPRGKHQIIEKIGDKMPKNTIFIGRESQGIWDKKPTNKDLILSRILWLDGLEPFNANSKDRCIYIHGTNDEENIGKTTSKGCIRMQNNTIIRLFNLVKIGEIVEII